jgi:hypothetical protein
MKKILSALTAIGILSFTVSAFATPISGTSTGTLTPAAGSTLTVAQVNSYQVNWTDPGLQTTYLTAGTSGGTDVINQNYATLGGSNVKLASLNWANVDNAKNKTVNVNWAITLNLLDPLLSNFVSINTLNVALLNGTHADTIALDNLSTIGPITIGTWVAENFHYFTGDSTVTGTNWVTTKGANSTLWIEADFRNTALPETAPVPEPGTMMLLGAGFLGLAIYGKRRKSA